MDAPSLIDFTKWAEFGRKGDVTTYPQGMVSMKARYLQRPQMRYDPGQCIAWVPLYYLHLAMPVNRTERIRKGDGYGTFLRHAFLAPNGCSMAI
jgi:hypothetical protein